MIKKKERKRLTSVHVVLVGRFLIEFFEADDKSIERYL
jgi:hypothetical protein